MSSVNNILLIREGDYKPNLYLDFLAQIRDFTEADDASYDFFVTTADTFNLKKSKSEKDFAIYPPAANPQDEPYEFSAEQVMNAHLRSGCDFVMLASVAPKGSDIVSAVDCLKNMQYLAMAKDGNMIEAFSRKLYKRDEVTIIPFIVTFKYPDHNIVTAATNSKLISIQEDLRIKQDDWRVVELFSEEPANASCVDSLFLPQLNIGSGFEFNNAIYQCEGEELSLDLFHELSIAGQCPNVISPEDFTIRSNMNYRWEESKLVFSLSKDKHAGFLSIFLDFGDIMECKHIHKSELPKFDFKVFHY
ncbi:hypothetical protein [Ewingella americana]|uniref:Uncharacterized protein n=1 Tax=Ewingella americana TaxID=41202 RepID=A0A502GE28_9GAMM|nr:hypothetical protein [Ewingella americana]TPG60124.1 hypothetical protein EAH77_16275 [Ewingella americana]